MEYNNGSTTNTYTHSVTSADIADAWKYYVIIWENNNVNLYYEGQFAGSVTFDNNWLEPTHVTYGNNVHITNLVLSKYVKPWIKDGELCTDYIKFLYDSHKPLIP